MEHPLEAKPFELDADGFDSRRVVIPLLCGLLGFYGAMMIVTAIRVDGYDPRDAWLPVLVVGAVYFTLMRLVRRLERSGQWDAVRARLVRVTLLSSNWFLTMMVVLNPLWQGLWFGVVLIAGSLLIVRLPRAEGVRMGAGGTAE